MPLPCGGRLLICIKIGLFVSKYHVHKVTTAKWISISIQLHVLYTLSLCREPLLPTYLTWHTPAGRRSSRLHTDGAVNNSLIQQRMPLASTKSVRRSFFRPSMHERWTGTRRSHITATAGPVPVREFYVAGTAAVSLDGVVYGQPGDAAATDTWRNLRRLDDRNWPGPGRSWPGTGRLSRE